LGKIRQLSEQLTNKIAAGEVVQRPASVVKELIENSIDAGATEIIIVIEDGGKELIQIIDNGGGMDEDDLLLAFDRHATSKIASYKELLEVQTLGFRGEALASIAAVAMVDVRSCLKGSLEGRRLTINGGKFGTLQPIPMQPGTVFEIRKLFFNTPARRKFLRETNTEYRHIIETVRQFALGYPNLRFSFSANGREVFLLPPAELPVRVGQLFTYHYTEKVIPVNFSAEAFAIDGVIGTLDLVRTRSGEQYLFINRRYVVDRSLNLAVYQSFDRLLDRGQFPFFVLNITIDPKLVDVNVHPQKTEIKFRDEWAVHNQLRNKLGRFLQEKLIAAPSFSQALPSADRSQPDGQNEINYSPNTSVLPAAPASNFLQAPQQPHSRSEQRKMNFSLPESAPILNNDLANKVRHFEKNLQNETPAEANPVHELAMAHFWQAHGRYIFAQIASGIVIVDQYAAHERILFEKAQKILANEAQTASQQLLFPLTIELTPDNFSLMLECFPALQKLGFVLREFGKNTLILEAIPAAMRYIDEGQVILEILKDVQERKNPGAAMTDKIAFAFAARAAVRSGDKLQPAEMQQLLDELFATPNPYFSPSGRPVIVQMTLNELDRRFERK
jgi:DNA mismatch repair protein MutL